MDNYNNYNQQPSYPAVALPSPGSILAFGLIGFFLGGILGLIFSAVAISKSGKYRAGGGVQSGAVTAGRVFGILGLIGSIISIICIVIYIILIVAGGTYAINLS